MDWQKLEKVYQKAAEAGVSFSLHYEEPADTWYFHVSSAAPDENFTTASSSFSSAIAGVVSWLDSILAQGE